MGLGISHTALGIFGNHDMMDGMGYMEDVKCRRWMGNLLYFERDGGEGTYDKPSRRGRISLPRCLIFGRRYSTTTTTA